MRAEITGIPPVPTGLTWASGSIEFSFDPNWSDGVGRGPGTITGILQPVTKDKFVVPGSLGALFVPATPTGIGVIRGPLMSMRWSLIDSQGREHRVDSVFPDSLLADASNQFSVNALGAVPTYVTSAGPAPVGVDLATGDARYVRFTSLATTGAVGISSFATNAEANDGVVSTKAIVPSALKSVLDTKFAVASVAALQAITPAQRAAGVVLVSLLTSGVYVWSAGSPRGTDGTFTVRPNDIAVDATPGRWHLIATDVFPTAPAAPVLTRVGGALPAPTFSTSTSAGTILGMYLYKIVYTVTPASLGYAELTLSAPAGYTAVVLSVGVYPTATGLPDPVAVNSPAFTVNYLTLLARNITLIVALVKA